MLPLVSQNPPAPKPKRVASWPAGLGVLAVIVALTNVGCSSPNRGQTPLALAQKTCESFQLPGTTPEAVGTFVASATTAGQITTMAKRFLGHALSPWDTLPSAHFVAQCDFGANPIPPGNSVTTVCPDGSVVDLTPATTMQFYVDEQGHWSPNPISAAIPRPAQC